MEYRELGKTGIRASVIGMGSEGLVDMKSEDAVEMIRYAIDHGVNYFDLYNPQPSARENLGKGIAGHRDQVYIQGHLCTTWINGQYTRTRDLKLTAESFETMLEKLGTDYVDVGMIHYVDKEEDWKTIFENGELIRYLQQLKAEGRVRHIGISSHNPVIAKKCVETGLIEVVLFSINPAYDMVPPSEVLDDLWSDYSYVNPLHNIDPDRDAFHKICAAEGVGITVMKAFAGGDLLDARLSPLGVAMTPAQCLAYALSRPGVASVMGGYHSLKECQEAVAYCDLPEEQKDFTVPLSHMTKHSFSGNCVYCGHCAPCTMSINIAAVNKFRDLCIAEGKVPETVRDHYRLLDHHASDCIQCGACEPRCPFKVSIIEGMEKAKEIFGY